jgi:hypothetical protein
MRRKKKHIQYVRKYLYNLKYDTLNKTFEASMKDFKDKGHNRSIKNNTLLIRKYQRRLFLLNF